MAHTMTPRALIAHPPVARQEPKNLVHPPLEVLPMSQRLDIWDGAEDWTGKTNTAVRRKLQNRLNQRAARRRKLQGKKAAKERTVVQEVLLEEHYLSTSLLPVKRPADWSAIRRYMSLHKRHSLLQATDFAAFLRTPLPGDQKLLTFLHFNLVRALMHNVHMLNLDPDKMSLDQTSPFADPKRLKMLRIEALPEALRPTELQMQVPHHPEVDCLPFPQFRDNRLRHGSCYPVDQYCIDLPYGVEEAYSPRTWGLSSRTGLIAWGDPWLQESWEVEEGFARKYRRFVGGCTALLATTNKWRASRGEPPLVLELDEDEEKRIEAIASTGPSRRLHS